MQMSGGFLAYLFLSKLDILLENLVGYKQRNEGSAVDDSSEVSTVS